MGLNEIFKIMSSELWLCKVSPLSTGAFTVTEICAASQSVKLFKKYAMSSLTLGLKKIKK